MTTLGENSNEIRRWAKNSKVVERPLEDEILLMDDEASAIFNLNSVGAAVWRLLSQPITREEIVAVLITAFPEGDAKQVQADVDALLEQLYSKGLVSQQIKD